MLKALQKLATIPSTFKARMGELCQVLGAFASSSNAEFALESKGILNQVQNDVRKMIVVWMVFLFSTVAMAANVGDIISNTAQATYTVHNIDKNSTSNEVNLTVEGTPAQIRFLRADGSGDENLTLGQSSCFDGSATWQSMPAPILPDGTVLDTTNPIIMSDASLYDIDDLLIIEVKDVDRNVDSTVRDVIQVTITSPSGGTETIQLVETSANSGVFTGYLPAVSGASAPHDGSLHVDPGEQIEVNYEDQDSSVKVDAATIAPYSHVFATEDGISLANIEVSLVEVSTGSVVAQTKSTKQIAGSTDNGDSKVAANSSIVFRFGSAPAGKYRIEVNDPDNSYYFPSVFSPNELKQYNYEVKEMVSYGETFSHRGGVLPVMDIPLDRDRAVVWIGKQVNKDAVSIGEIVQYTLAVHNDGNSRARDLVVDDHLPLGVKYKKGTSKLEGADITPSVSEDGKHLYYKIAEVEAKSTATITFIAEITAGVVNGEAINEAWVSGQGIPRSNRASATVRVKEELMRSKGIIIGQIYECAYENNKKGHGVANVRLYMENGTYVVTDKNGKYHIEGVDAGTHVVQMDVDMLPDGYEMGKNAKNARFAGRDFSQFVDVGRGALKRVDFCLNRTVVVKQDANAIRAKTKVADIYDYTIPTAVPTMPKYNRSHLGSLKGKTEILWPPEKFVPSIPSTRIAVVHDKNQKAEVWLNDQKVSMLNYDGRKTDTNNSTVIDTYKGVDLLDQTNTITVKILNKQNQVIKTLTRILHVSSAPVKVEYIAKNSFAVADGKHSPVIAVKFIDADGYPLRAGITGTFSIEAPYQSQVALDQLQENPLGGATGENRYTIHSGGIAYIKLQPTTQSGTASLHFKIQERDEVIRAWLKPQLREWIMVGFAEGTVGYNTLKGHQESLDAKGAEDKVVTEGRVSFFAKGRIKGEWLLTMAYDSGKDTKNSKLFDEIDPNTYYTLYNDGSVQNYEAASRKKLFLKIEKERFSALFGDFSTDMTYTELSQYSRRMTGVKSEYHGENIEATAFVAHTDQLFMKDEIRGDGTSGFYHLKNKPIILNSESVTIEVRDRYHNERVIEKKTLQRFRDYEIDYDRGTLYFKEPIYSNDKNFNPRFIVVDYEIEGDGSKHYTYGGRAAFKTLKGALEIGGSYIHEDTAKKQSELYGADTTIKVGANTAIKAEYAKTKTTQDGNTTYGDAKLAEVEHVSNGLHVRAYYREQEDSFGLGQISSSLGATRKLGIDATKTFDNRLSLKASAYRDTDLLNSKDQDVFEFRAQMDKTLWSAYTGYRFADHADTQAVHQMLFGASYAFFDQRLKLSAMHDQSFGKDEDKLFPTKTTVGLDYALTSSLNLFANYEWAKGTEDHELGRVGMRYRPWSGMTFENTTVSEFTNDTTRIYNTLGMLQTYQFNKNWSFNVGYERGELLDGNLTGENDTFDAYRLGVNYHTDTWTALINGEYRNGQKENKYNFTAGVYTQANDALALALSAGYNKVYDDFKSQKDADLRFSLAYRPEQTNWIVLEKLDYIYTKNDQLENDTTTQKVINNLNFNYTPSVDMEVSLQHGIKYVVDTVEEYEHKGITQLFGVDIRYDITGKWEMGAQASVLYAQSADNWDYGFGLYTGYNLFDNMLLTLGYNWEGFEDRDFSLQTYRIEGPYAQFRMKFDQQSLKDIVRLMSW
ncbi:MAG: DUF11 domain-containing protein [Sulfurovum sp.]|nr:MAG: DUF11 domain-containing protein [Sulfurovum sp.]